LAKAPRTRDPLAEALRTQRIRRFVIAVTIIAFLCFTPPMFELVDRLAPGKLPIWLMLVWILSITCVAVAMERQSGERKGEAGRRSFDR
jgi:MFS superfamily sulfate permease-like transporter